MRPPRKSLYPATTEDALEAFDRLIVAVEWAVPAICDGVDAEDRCRILMRYARGSKAILNAVRLNIARAASGTSGSAQDAQRLDPKGAGPTAESGDAQKP